MAGTLEIVNSANIAFLLNKPCATLYQTSSFTVNSSANTQVPWNSASGDLWGGWSSGSNTRWTVPVAGWYKLEASVTWPGNSSGARHVEFYQNGVENINSLAIWNPSPGTESFSMDTNPVILQAAVGDYFQVNLWQNSGTNFVSGTNGMVTVGTWTIEFDHF